MASVARAAGPVVNIENERANSGSCVLQYVVCCRWTVSAAVSVRIDADVQRALATLEATGISRSEAIRKSILDAAQTIR